MTTASDPQVTNELLSAYIDGAVSEEERRLIETAVLQDPEVAWRLESLRATVRLLHELPELSLPRSFLLTPEQVQQPAVAAAAVLPIAAKTRSADAQARADAGGFWQAVWRGWQGLWQGGSPALRNAMAASFAVLLALLLAPRFLAPPSLPAVGQVQTVAVQPPAGQLPTEQLPTAKQQATASVQEYAANEGADMANAAAAQPPEPAPVQTSEMQSVAAEVAAEPASPDTGSAAADAAAKAAPRSVPETAAETAAESAASMAEATSMIAQERAEDAQGAIGMAAAEAEAPAAAAAAPVVLPAAAAAPAPEQAQGVTLAQSASGASVLDDMQRQAGGGAPESMTVASVAPPLVLEAAAAGGAAEAAPVSPLAATATAAPTAEPTATATALPTVAPTVAPTAAIAMAPAEVQASDQVEAVEPPAAVPAGATGSPAWLLLTLQGGALLAGVATILFGLLWWRSRG